MLETHFVADVEGNCGSLQITGGNEELTRLEAVAQLKQFACRIDPQSPPNFFFSR